MRVAQVMQSVDENLISILCSN